MWKKNNISADFIRVKKKMLKVTSGGYINIQNTTTL
jgi:hypothetical protein